MKTPFSVFLALRYLKPKRTFVSIITLISILGVTLGITVLIVVMSVMTGFSQELRKKVLGFDAHILVTSPSVIRDWRPLDDKIRATPGVLASAPYVQGPVLVEFHGKILTPQVRGIDFEREKAVTDLSKLIWIGDSNIQGDCAAIGTAMAAELEINLGDKLLIQSPRDMKAIIEALKEPDSGDQKKKTLEDIKELILPHEVTVTGIFESGRFVYDSSFVLVPVNVAQELYGLEDGLHGISVRTDDPDHADIVQKRLEKFLPPTLEAPTWMDRNKGQFEAIAMEGEVMFFILLFIVIVAAFGVMNTLITITVQKTREIGIMKALGASTSQIVWVFLAQGMIVGFFGNVTGLLLGLTCVHWRNEFKQALSVALGRPIFDPNVYQFYELPAKVVPHDVVVICASAFFICSLAALIPAFFAARLDPVVALRRE